MLGTKSGGKLRTFVVSAFSLARASPAVQEAVNPVILGSNQVHEHFAGMLVVTCSRTSLLASGLALVTRGR